MDESVSQRLAKYGQQKYPEHLTDENGIMFEFVGLCERAKRPYVLYATPNDTETRLAEPLGGGKVWLLTATENDNVWNEMQNMDGKKIYTQAELDKLLFTEHR